MRPIFASSTDRAFFLPRLRSWRASHFFASGMALQHQASGLVKSAHFRCALPIFLPPEIFFLPADSCWSNAPIESTTRKLPTSGKRFGLVDFVEHHQFAQDFADAGDQAAGKPSVTGSSILAVLRTVRSMSSIGGVEVVNQLQIGRGCSIASRDRRSGRRNLRCDYAGSTVASGERRMVVLAVGVDDRAR